MSGPGVGRRRRTRAAARVVGSRAVAAGAAAYRREPPPRGFDLGIHAFCKINLGLAVGRRRPDGFHDVDTVLQTVEFADTLYARVRPRGLRLRVVRRGPARRAGLTVSSGTSNLVLRAARAARRALGEARGADLVLVKRVPAGSGLGGGSSDAAAALRLLERLWRRPLGAAGRRRLARGVGSDCAFFLDGGRARATGRGERLRRLPVPTRAAVLLALPRRGVRTAHAYRLLDRAREAGNRRNDVRWTVARAEPTAPKLIRLTVSEPPHNIGTLPECRPPERHSRGPSRNDLEEVISRHYPEVRAAKALLEELGVEAPRMSGSGSAVFGLLPAAGGPGGADTRLRHHPFELVLARFTRVGSLWCQ